MTELNDIDMYYPTVDSARIHDSIPKELGSQLLEDDSDSEDVMQSALDETDPSRREHEPVPGAELIGRHDFIIHLAAKQDIVADLPDSRVNKWANSLKSTIGAGDPADRFTKGLTTYVDSVYERQIGFERSEDISVESYRDGDVTLSVDLHYTPGAEFIDDVELPGSLTVKGEVREEYRQELERVE